MIIKEIKNKKDLGKSVEIIARSFKTVAEEFCLTKENCPTHPSFITFEKLNDLAEKNVRMFGLFDAEKQTGFIAVEKADDALYYLEKLAVLPEHRHCGCGKQLMDFVFKYVKENGGRKISIAIINKHKKLKEWYINYGFRETGIKEIRNLPFIVCFMEKSIN